METELEMGLERTGDSGNSLVVQWLGLCAFTAEGLGSIPDRGTKIPQAAWCSQKIIHIALYACVLSHVQFFVIP